MVGQTAWHCSSLLCQHHGFKRNSLLLQHYCQEVSAHPLSLLAHHLLFSLFFSSLINSHWLFFFLYILILILTHVLLPFIQALMDEILMLQDEIGELQMCFSEELAESDGDAGEQLALQSTLTVLGERMATIRMKASGKRQLLEVIYQDLILFLVYHVLVYVMSAPYLYNSGELT